MIEFKRKSRFSFYLFYILPSVAFVAFVLIERTPLYTFPALLTLPAYATLTMVMYLSFVSSFFEIIMVILRSKQVSIRMIAGEEVVLSVYLVELDHSADALEHRL